MPSSRLVLLAALGAALGAAAPAEAAITVSPQPGTPTASYKTQLSFRGLAPSAVRGIRVTGSRSGRHTGTVRAHSDRQGASLVFREDFRRGESVLVESSLAIVGATSGDYRFKVAGLGNSAAIVVAQEPPSKLGAGLRDSFHSRPDLAPPATSVSRRSDAVSPGLLFLNARNRTARGQQGPMIVDDRGELVWFRPVRDRNRAMDVKAQRYRGKPVVTWWEGKARQGAGSGEGVIVDDSYRTIRRVRGGNGYRLDLHDFQITPQNTALVAIYNPIARDLSSSGGSRDGRVVDGIIQEIDIATGLVLFEWHSLGTVPIGDSYSKAMPKVPFDYFHLNAVSLDADGNLLASARGTWAAYKIDRRSGAILWRLSGKKSDFRMGPDARFAWQHDVERAPDGTITLFDNSAFPPVRKRSRGLVLDVDERARTATVRQQFEHPRGLLAANQGSFQTLPNGNRFIGWGPQRRYSEFTPDGQLIFDGSTSPANDSYRARRLPWVGRPAATPAIVAESRAATRTAVFASFNGQTGVASWEVLAGRSRGSLAPVATAPRTRFEAALSVASAGPYFAVRAKDAGGAVLGTSRTIRRR